MEEEKPLYEDSQFKIDYLANSGEDHYITVKLSEKDEISCVLQRHVLRELAKKPGGMLEKTIQVFNDNFMFCLEKKGIEIDKLHIAICQAYLEEQNRINRFRSNL
ncbi:hypothetical protein KY304_00210 [Candidatus Woesearchaeota archaeon]|nr:hypothetical protein [Candidatus Woesearchaeota archaeon]